MRHLAGGARTYWHEPAARDRHAFPPLRLADDKATALLECERRNAELDRWRAGLAPPAAEASRYPKGTLGRTIEAYRASTAWRELAPRTRADYGKHLDTLEAELGKAPLLGFTRPAVMRYRAGLTPGRQANYRLAVLRIVLGHAYDAGEIAANPARGVKGFPLRRRDGWWSDQAIERFLAEAPEPMRLAMFLGLYTGQREADVIALRWPDIEDDWLMPRQGKTGRRVAIPIAKPLAAELARARAWQEERKRRGLVILIGERGAPYTGDGFRTQWHRTTKAAGLAGLAFLDLRRTAVVRLAEAGCTVPEIASITGHSIAETQRILDTYWVATRPQARAAITKLERRKSPRTSPRGGKKVSQRDS